MPRGRGVPSRHGSPQGRGAALGVRCFLEAVKAESVSTASRRRATVASRRRNSGALPEKAFRIPPSSCRAGWEKCLPETLSMAGFGLIFRQKKMLGTI